MEEVFCGKGGGEQRKGYREKKGGRQRGKEKKKRIQLFSLRRLQCWPGEHQKNHRILTFESQEKHLLSPESWAQVFCDRFGDLLISKSESATEGLNHL